MDKKKFDKYLTLRNSAGDIRFVAIFNILMFSDLLGILPLYGEPRISFFIYLGIVPALILNIWAILYVVAPYRFESSFILFYGVWGNMEWTKREKRIKRSATYNLANGGMFLARYPKYHYRVILLDLNDDLSDKGSG